MTQQLSTPPTRLNALESTSHNGERREESVLLPAMEVLLRRWRLLVLIPAVLVALVVARALIGPGKWVSTSQFTPQSQRMPAPSALMGIAAQLGSFGNLGNSESIDFYAALVRSREILEQIAQTEYPDPTSSKGERRNLIALYDLAGKNPREQLNRAVKRLEDDIDVGTDPRSNLVTVSVTAPSPVLAEQIHARLLALVTEFNMQRRQSGAHAEREFVEKRLAVAANELEDAEGELRRFDEANRRSDVPSLALARARLARRVEQRSSLYTTLSTSYEQARMEEVRNTPVITIIEHPEGSAEKKGGFVLALFGAMVFGLGLSAVAALLLEFLQQNAATIRRRSPHLAALLARVRLVPVSSS